jgi:two-component system NtrC family response regulator
VRRSDATSFSGASTTLGGLEYLCRKARVYAECFSWASVHDTLASLLDPQSFQSAPLSTRAESLGTLLLACHRLGHSDHLTEGIAQLRSLVRLAAKLTSEARLRVATVMTRAELEGGHQQAATRWIETISSDDLRDGSDHAATTFLITVAACAARFGDLASAERYALVAVSRAESSCNPALHGDALGVFGNVLKSRGDCLEEAQKVYARAIGLYWRSGERVGLARALLNRAWLLNRLGHLADSYLSFSEALDVAQAHGIPATALRARLGMGWVQVRRGNYEKARKLLIPALRETRRRGLLREEALALEYLSECHILRGSLARARCTLRRCRGLVEVLAAKGDVAVECMVREALLALAENDLDLARTLSTDAVGSATELGMNWERAQGQRLLGVCLALRGQHRGALVALREADRLYGEMGEVYERKIVKRWLNEIRASHASNRSIVVSVAPVKIRDVLPWDEHPLLSPVGVHAEGPGEANEHPYGSAAEEIQPASDVHPIWASLGLVTRTPELIDTLRTAESLATDSLPILIHGATGTGKELLARGIHDLSRREGLFLPFNCAACQPDLVVVELFGARKGSYTGADQDREGLLAAASSGTIFLDEVADLDAKAQGALLRFLDSGEVRSVGTPRTYRVDTRVIAATHRKLRESVMRGQFRRDLYFRLAGSVLDLPGLRERILDLEALAEHLWLRHGGRAEDLRTVLIPKVVDAIAAMRWPGNVRQLSNAVRLAVVKFRQGEAMSARKHLLDPDGLASGPDRVPGRRRLNRPSEDDVSAALAQAKGKVREAARLLGVSRGHAYRLMREYGIDPKARRAEGESDF